MNLIQQLQISTVAAIQSVFSYKDHECAAWSRRMKGKDRIKSSASS